MNFLVSVRVMPREGLLDPQGQAVEHALHELEFEGTSAVRIGRAIEMALEAPDESAAQDRAREMCQRLLANPVTEDFTIEVRQP